MEHFLVEYRSVDALVRARLRKWPQEPPGLGALPGEPGRWLRARPMERDGNGNPFLKVAGSNRLRTLPDGLWLRFGGTRHEPFVDILVIEACSTVTNLMDKRSRFAPSTQSLLAVCPPQWLAAPVGDGRETPRWLATGVFRTVPVVPVALPVRDLRVLYCLKPTHYRDFARTNVPHPHEYFAPMQALTAEDGDKDPAMQAFLSRATARANFLSVP